MRNSENYPITKIILHCSATRPSMDIGLTEITQWHLSRGFNDIGYHFIIRRDGSIELGRPISVIGAHALNYNRGSIGICLVGGVTEHNINQPEDNFTHQQYSALSLLLDDLLQTHMTAEIVGHNGLTGHESRGCPSFNWRSYLTWLNRARRALYRPDDWHRHDVYDWHNSSPDSWDIPSTFYDAAELIERDDSG